MRFRSKYTQFHKSISGFTLIELLVVIAIIALLMAIIMPGIKKAKDQTKFVMCATNLHQMGVAFYLYAADNHDRITPGNQPNGVTIWYTEAYGPGQLLTGGYLPLPTSKESAIIFCPADVDRYSAGPMPAGYTLADVRWFEGRWGVPGMCVDFGYEFRDSLDGNWTSGWPPGVTLTSCKGAPLSKIAHHSLISDWWGWYTYYQHKLKYNVLLGDGSIYVVNDRPHEGGGGNIQDPREVGLTNWVLGYPGYDYGKDYLTFDAIDYLAGSPMWKIPQVGAPPLADPPLPYWR